MALAAVVGLRLLLSLYMAAIASFLERPDLWDRYAHMGVGLLDSGWERLWLGVWQREDAIWYQKISAVGYSSEDMTPQLFPLFPLAMRLVVLLTGLHPIAAGLVVSDLCLLVALYLLHRLLLPRLGTGVATRTVAYLSLFPTAFFLHGPFSESLMLMLAILGFYLVGRGWWPAAVLVAYLAGLARPQGMLLGLPMALQLLAGGQPLSRWRAFRWRGGASLVAVALIAAPLLGLTTFQSMVDTPWDRPGAPGGAGPMAVQWAAVPGTDLVLAAERIIAGEAYHVDVFGFVLAILFPLLAVASFRWMEASYSLYALFFVLAPLSRASPYLPLMSFSRFVLLLFPCFVVLALWGRNRLAHLGIILISLLLLLYWSAVFAYGVFVA